MPRDSARAYVEARDALSAAETLCASACNDHERAIAHAQSGNARAHLRRGIELGTDDAGLAMQQAALNLTKAQQALRRACEQLGGVAPCFTVSLVAQRGMGSGETSPERASNAEFSRDPFWQAVARTRGELARRAPASRGVMALRLGDTLERLHWVSLGIEWVARGPLADAAARVGEAPPWIGGPLVRRTEGELAARARRWKRGAVLWLGSGLTVLVAVLAPARLMFAPGPLFLVPTLSVMVASFAVAYALVSLGGR